VLKATVHDQEGSEDAKFILTSLAAYNAKTGGRVNWREVTITLKDDQGKIVAGLNGSSDLGWLFIRLLWVDDAFHGQGLGGQLLELVEKEAVKRGCKNLWIDTFNPVALKLYQKHGFKIFGELENYPKPRKRIFLQKQI